MTGPLLNEVKMAVKMAVFCKEAMVKFTSDEYEQLIEFIKSVAPPSIGLWSIEEYWRGYQ